MPQIQSLCIFCASSPNVDQKYITLAREIGTFCATQNIRIIYGGAQDGLMGAAANAALDNNGKVIGIIPKILAKNTNGQERAHQNLTKLHIVKDMHTRQQKMADLADAFLILPGGIGTLAEFFEIMTWKSISIHNKPIALLNAYGFWDHLLQTLNHCENQQFLHQSPATLFTTLPDLPSLYDFFKH